MVLIKGAEADAETMTPDTTLRPSITNCGIALSALLMRSAPKNSRQNTSSTQNGMPIDSGTMVQMGTDLPGKIAICQSGPQSSCRQRRPERRSEVAPHLKEDGDRKGERDGSCRARTRNDGKRAAKRQAHQTSGGTAAPTMMAPMNMDSKAAPTITPCWTSPKDQADKQACKQRTTKHRNAK